MRSRGLLIIIPVVCACAGEVEDSAAPARFEDLFELVELVELEETSADPIVGVDRISVAHDGSIVIADRQAERVRLFGADGISMGGVGRKGDGPGEFDGLSDSFLGSGGRLYASDAGNGRISRFSRDLEFDTAFSSPGAFAYRLVEFGDQIVVAVHERGRGSVWRLDHEGQRIAEISLPDSGAWSVPYWGAVMSRDLAPLGGELIITNSLLYPLWNVNADGRADSLGSPPASFREASRPALGQFAGARQAAVQDWLRSFTFIDRGVVYRDSLLIVVHGAYRPIPGEPWRRVHTALDIYDGSGKKLYSDVPLPGRVLSGGPYLFLLAGEPPGPWSIGKFAWSRTGRS